MEHSRDQSTINGKPEVALLALALLPLIVAFMVGAARYLLTTPSIENVG